MMPHGGIGEQFGADEEMSLVDRALGFGKCRADDREVRAQFGQKGIGNGSDIAPGSRIESRAIFEIDLAGAVLLKPAAGSERLRDGCGLRRGARFESDDYGI